MPENDFEKQVQQLLNELRLKPSAEVWPQVHNRIQKGKGSKSAFIWSLLAILLLSSGGYWLLQNNNNLPSSNSITKSTPGSKNSNGNISAKANEATAPLKNNNDISNTGKQTIEEPATKSAGNMDKNAPLHNGGSGSDSKASNGQQNAVKPPVNNQALDNNQQQALLSVLLPLPDNAGNENVTAISGANQLKEKNKQRQQIADSGKRYIALSDNKNPFSELPKNLNSTPIIPVLQSVTVNTLLLPVKTEKRLKSVSTDQLFNSPLIARANNTPVKLSRKKSWEWGIAGAAGASEVSKGLSGLLGSSAVEKSIAYSAPNNSVNNIGILTGQNNYLAAMPPPASIIKAGFAWQAGGFGKRFITSKLALTVGLNYRYYSTNRQVGNVINNYGLRLSNTSADVSASFAGYYSGDNSINYSNQYHFIEMPIGVQWQLNKATKLPLYLNAGVSIAYLANTNAVHYHSPSGAYYEDKSLFNKMQVGIYAGLSTKLFNKTGRPLYVGPVIQYQTTNLLRSSAQLRQNLVFAGLKAEWILWKK